MAISKTVLDELLKEYKGPADLTGPDGILKELTKALLERVMEAELTEHLGYERHESGEKMTSNRRNGSSPKTLRSDQGTINLEIPRDRDSEFQPQIIPKHQRDFKGFDDKILSMYALGLTTRDICQHLKEIYGVEVSAELISRVTDSVKELLDDWRNRVLDAVYPVIFLDALVINVREGSQIFKKAVYLALAIRLDGQKELLGLWIDQNEGAKFWLGILNELHNRGVQDILIACVDGLTGFPEAINTVFPKTEVQLCIVHMIRNSLKYVSYKDRKMVANDLKLIYTATSEENAIKALSQFSQKWEKKYSMIAKNWEKKWIEVVPFLKFPTVIRKVIYTTNTIESLNFSIRKVIKNRPSFPNNEAAMKLIFMALQNISKKWTLPFYNWGEVINQLSIFYPGRVPL